MAEMEVHNREAQHRFEVEAEGKTAFLTYSRHPSEMVLLHTEVPKELEGRGIGGRLAKAALEFARQQKLKIVVRCPFVAEYLKRHPEYADLA